MSASTIAVIGSGSLASAVCRSFAVTDWSAGLPSQGLEVLVIARNTTAAKSVSLIAGGLAGLSNQTVRFRPVLVDFTSPLRLAQALRMSRPAGVVQCASYQSPWEGRRSPSAWTETLRRGGFGLSLPLHAVLALHAGQATATASPSAWFLNACFPDAVNPVLAQLGVPVVCGGGNVGTIGAALQHHFGVADQARLKVIAHHAHLHPAPGPAEEALVWLDDTPTDGVAAALDGLRSAPREQIGEIAGVHTAQLAWALLTGAELAGSAPGPLGLPGGYPIHISGGKLSLRLPPSLSAAEAVAFNQRAALCDGAVVEAGTVRYSSAARAELERKLPYMADGFNTADITCACERLLELRARLRKQPAWRSDGDQ